jgi:prepilin-type N-terminal cleavage/methylation domain-containing protein
MMSIDTNIATNRSKGVTLIELMVALVASSILIAALYRTFISQQKTYIVQEQVVDMQQSARVAINRMMREIRMAGFGNISMILPVSFTVRGKTRSFADIANPDTPVSGALTIVSAIGETATLEKKLGDWVAGIRLLPNQIQVSRLTDSQGDTLFDDANRRYLSIGGFESHEIIPNGVDRLNKIITLSRDVSSVHQTDGTTLIYPIRATSYEVVSDQGMFILKRDGNLGGGRQPLAENIENLQCEYFDAKGKAATIPGNIRMIRVTVTARGDKPDPELKGGDGYRRRQIASSVCLRNMGSSP